MENLDDKFGPVTGSTHVIGEVITRRLVTAGTTVVHTGRGTQVQDERLLETVSSATESFESSHRNWQNHGRVVPEANTA